MGVWPISTSYAALKYPRRHCNNGRLDHICSGILETLRENSVDSLTSALFNQLITEPITDSLNPDTTTPCDSHLSKILQNYSNISFFAP